MENENWNNAELKELVQMRMGSTILQKDLSENGTPVFSAGSKCEIWGYTERQVQTYQKGTIVVSARGTIGFPKLPEIDIFTSTQTTIAVTPNKNVNTRYLLYFLTAVNWGELVSGVAIPMLTITKLVSCQA